MVVYNELLLLNDVGAELVTFQKNIKVWIVLGAI